MIEMRRWNVEVFIGEQDGQTHAEARFIPETTTTLTGHGLARLRPQDYDVPEIGAELATSRALSDLAHQLLEAAATDIEGVTHAPTQLQA